MKIGELSTKTGVPTKTIRYYEDIGVLPSPKRAPNGYRDYADDSVERLRFVRDAQATGLSLTEISSVLDLRRKGVGTCDHVTGLMLRHLEDLDRHIETLRRTRDHLAALTKRAQTLDSADCTDPIRCQTIEAGANVDSSELHSPPAAHAH